MPPVDETPSFEPGPPTPSRKAKTGASEQPSAPDLVSVTIDAASSRIVKVEGVDAAGARRELSEDEKERLAKRQDGVTLQRIVEQAFEAGIACVLGDRASKAEPTESEDDAEISRMLLQSLIKRSAAERLMQREILSRAIARTLVEQAASFSAAAH